MYLLIGHMAVVNLVDQLSRCFPRWLSTGFQFIDSLACTFPFEYMIDILEGIKRCLLMILICISLLANGHFVMLFVYLLERERTHTVGFRSSAAGQEANDED